MTELSAGVVRGVFKASPRSFVLRLVVAIVASAAVMGHRHAAVSCHKINAKGAGQDLADGHAVAQIIGGGLLQGTTKGSFAITGGSPPVFMMSATVAFATKQSTLTATVARPSAVARLNLGLLLIFSATCGGSDAVPVEERSTQTDAALNFIIKDARQLVAVADQGQFVANDSLALSARKLAGTSLSKNFTFQQSCCDRKSLKQGVGYAKAMSRMRISVKPASWHEIRLCSSTHTTWGKM